MLDSMEKKHIIRFLKEKKKGVYSLLVNQYSDIIATMALTMAMEVIREDLQLESESAIELNYFSFAKAICRFRKNNKTPRSVTAKKWEFKDASEVKDVQSGPGKFRIS